MLNTLNPLKMIGLEYSRRQTSSNINIHIPSFFFPCVIIRFFSAIFCTLFPEIEIVEFFCIYVSESTCFPENEPKEQKPYICTAPIKVRIPWIMMLFIWISRGHLWLFPLIFCLNSVWNILFVAVSIFQFLQFWLYEDRESFY